jgi:hypothetical protein
VRCVGERRLVEELFGVTRYTVYRALARTGATSPRATAAR